MYQRVQKILFFPFLFLDVNSSFTTKDRLLKFSVVIFGIMMEGTMSQVFLGPSFRFI